MTLKYKQISHQPPFFFFQGKPLKPTTASPLLPKLRFRKAGRLPAEINIAQNSRRGVKFSEKGSVKSLCLREGRTEKTTKQTKPIWHSGRERLSETRSHLGKYYIINTYDNMYTLIYISKGSLTRNSISFQNKASLYE